MHSFEWIDATSVEQAAALLAARRLAARSWPRPAASISST